MYGLRYFVLLFSPIRNKFVKTLHKKKHASRELNFWVLKIALIKKNVEHSHTERRKNTFNNKFC